MIRSYHQKCQKEFEHEQTVERDGMPLIEPVYKSLQKSAGEFGMKAPGSK